MIVTIFGSTGGTGRELVRLALERDHSVTAVARDPNAVDVAHERLVVRRADVLDPDSLPAVITGAGAVLSALGTAASRAPTTVYSAGLANILEAMRAADVHRFIGISAAPVIPRSETAVSERLLVFPILYRFFVGGVQGLGPDGGAAPCQPGRVDSATPADAQRQVGDRALPHGAQPERSGRSADHSRRSCRGHAGGDRRPLCSSCRDRSRQLTVRPPCGLRPLAARIGMEAR